MSDADSPSTNRVAAPVDVVARFLNDVINGGDVGLIDELWAADMSWHGGSLGEYHGREQWKAVNTHAAAAFTDMHLTVHDIVAEAQKVAVRFTNSGRHTGPFMGVPATGKQVEWLGIGIYTVRAGKIVDAWFGEDMLGLLLALGAITLPATTA